MSGLASESSARRGRPAILRFVEDVARGWVPGTPGRLTSGDARILGLAAAEARTRYPGPVGELVAREIWAYCNFGHRLGSDGVIPRIVAELLHSSSGHSSSGHSSSLSSEAARAAPSDSTGR